MVFGLGVCYFWPTMLGFVSENLPETGAVGINLMGGAGMFAVSIYTIFMGSHYDNLLAAQLPVNADIKAFMEAPPGSDMANQLIEAKKAAGPAIIKTTFVIPVILIVAFTTLFFYKKNQKNKTMIVAQS